MSRAFVFPGQGSQAVGMGRDLAEASAAARAVFEEVDEALGEKLSALMFDGDAEALTLTRNAQPALMAVSVAVARVLAERAGRPVAELGAFVAGHSLGEYSALTVVGAFSLADAARLLRLRGDAMQRAVPVGVGAMAALLGAERDAAEAFAAEAAQGEVCTIANDNAPGQIVISGHRGAVERAVAIAAGAGIRRSVLLPVSAPFHCPLMAPAAQEMAEAVANIRIEPPLLPVVTNVLATAETDPTVLRRLLVEQITGVVRWREGVEYMASQGVGTLVELGAGKVLTGLTRRIDRTLEGLAIGTSAEIDAFVASLDG